MALLAPGHPATSPPRKPAIRGRSLAALAAITVVLLTAAVLLPPIVPAGADLNDANQAAYARAIWPEAQISLAMLMIFLPSLCYAVAARGTAWGRLLIASISLVGVAVATFYVVISLQSYVAKPEVVYGAVTSLSGRAICLQFGGTSQIVRHEPVTRCFALDVPSEELRGAENWAQEGWYVHALVSPRGHVGYIAPVSGVLQ
jgi:hypothetical protein